MNFFQNSSHTWIGDMKSDPLKLKGHFEISNSEAPPLI